MKMNRRSFLKGASALGLAIGLPIKGAKLPAQTAATPVVTRAESLPIVLSSAKILADNAWHEIKLCIQKGVPVLMEIDKQPCDDSGLADWYASPSPSVPQIWVRWMQYGVAGPGERNAPSALSLSMDPWLELRTPEKAHFGLDNVIVAREEVDAWSISERPREVVGGHERRLPRYRRKLGKKSSVLRRARRRNPSIHGNVLDTFVRPSWSV